MEVSVDQLPTGRVVVPRLGIVDAVRGKTEEPSLRKQKGTQGKRQLVANEEKTTVTTRCLETIEAVLSRRVNNITLRRSVADRLREYANGRGLYLEWRVRQHGST